MYFFFWKTQFADNKINILITNSFHLIENIFVVFRSFWQFKCVAVSTCFHTCISSYQIGESPRVCSRWSNWYYLLLIWGRAKVSSIAIELLCTRRTTRPNMPARQKKKREKQNCLDGEIRKDDVGNPHLNFTFEDINSNDFNSLSCCWYTSERYISNYDKSNGYHHQLINHHLTRVCTGWNWHAN